ncbi:MFS transporter [bacterium]|nr:MFS transporter [bacterium]
MTGGLMQADVLAYERAFELNHEQVSYWLSLFSLLTGVCGGLAGLFADLWGAGRVYRMSLVLSGLGLMAFGSALPGLVLPGFFLAGFGIGGLFVGNILVSQADVSSPNRAINRLHASHGIARTAGVALSIVAIGYFWQMSYLVLGAAALALGALYRPASSSPPVINLSGTSHPDSSALASISLPLLSAGFILYMTAEIVLVTWLPAYMEVVRGWSSGSAKFAYIVFLAGLIFGRLWSAAKCPTEFSAAACRNLALAHAVLLPVFLYASHPAFLLGLLFAAGWCEGPGWTALYAYAIRRCRGWEGRLTGVIYVVCCFGIILCTAASGVMAERWGISSIFILVVLAHLLFSGVFYLLLGRQTNKPINLGLTP